MRLTRRQILAASASGSALLLAGTGCKTDPTSAPTLGSTSVGSDEPTERNVERVLAARPTLEGAGVHINRAIGGPLLGMLDPFLLLDEFQSDDPNDYAAGFPSIRTAASRR